MTSVFAPAASGGLSAACQLGSQAAVAAAEQSDETRPLRARYDAAATTDDNRRHWANADGLSANVANNPEVRRILRNRARYEVANNSYARGIVLTLANDVVGAGPRLQLLTDDAEANRLIEREFVVWAKAVNLAEKLRTMRMARAQDGEAFAVMTSNPKLPTSVQLDLRLIEADQVTTPATRSSTTCSSSTPATRWAATCWSSTACRRSRCCTGFGPTGPARHSASRTSCRHYRSSPNYGASRWP